MSKTYKSRIINKHDSQENWEKALAFIPFLGEIIIYDIDENYNYERLKIGDGIHTVNELQFIDEFLSIPSERIIHNEEYLLSELLNEYLLNVDYENLLSFDTDELVFNKQTAILGQAILG